MKQIVAILVSSLLLAPMCKADTTISIVTDAESVQILVKDAKVKIMSAESDARFAGEALYDAEQKTLTIIDHQNKTLFPLDEQTVKRVGGTLNAAVSAVHSQLEALPSAQRKQMEDMIRGFGLSIPSKQGPELSLSKGKFTSRGQLKCQEHSLMRGETKLAELCVSQNSGLGLDPDDYTTLLAAQNFVLDAASHAQQLAEQYGQRIPNFGGLQLDGILIHSQQLQALDENSTIPQNGNFSVTSISKRALETLTTPSGYRVKTMP